MRYKQVNQLLIEELADLVMKGQSITLFAPRYGGKRHVMKRVRVRLEELGQTNIVRLKLLGETPLLVEQELNGKLLQAVKNAGIEVPDRIEDPFDAIEAYAKSAGKRVILLVSNIDAIAHNLTRRLLEHFRKLVQKERLTVVLSGESDFVELVHGPNSDFNCSENFFLQGHTEEDFPVFLNQYNKALNITLDKPEEIQSHFWQRTGGNTYLVRPLIVEVVEKAARNGEVITDHALTMKDFERMPGSKHIPGNYWTQLCRHATRIVAWDPDCWPTLRQLINEGRVIVEDQKPTQLEWAGIAVREGDYLKFASEMMENYARRHYTDLHWGDLYGRNGRWTEAFNCYEQLTAEERRRPLSADDRTETGKNVSAFGRALFSLRTVDEVRSLFARGCRNLLGFGEITFWRYEKEQGWQFRQLNGSEATPSEALASQVEKILGKPEAIEGDFFCIPAEWNDFVVAARLESSSTDYVSAVVVSDLNDRITIFHERRRLLKSLLQQFIEAHNHAAKVQKTEHRLANRDLQMDLLNSIFKAIGSQVTDVDGVLRLAAGRLFSLGYKRVLFCLIDPERKYIDGVFDYSDDWPIVDIAKMTHYPLDDRNSDIQSYVIATGVPFSTTDAGKETRTYKAAVEKGKMKGLAIIPILNHAGKAIGTIHLERNDQLQPSEAEIGDILTFGRLLATAIEQAERIHLLQSTLDQIPAPVAVVGVRKEFRYANKAAADLIGVKNRWYDQSEFQAPLEGVQPAIQKAAEQALAGQRFFQNIGIWDGQIDMRSILSNRLTDWRDKTVGAFLYLQELTDFDRVFKSFLTIVSRRKNTDEALEAMQEAVGQLGYEESRLYIVDPMSGHLVSQKWHGATDLAKASLFNQRYIKNPPGEMATSHTWKSIVARKPLVFCFRQDGQEGQIGKTPQGLEYFVTNEREEQQGFLGKKPGDMWIDLPLLAEDRPLGKLILPCNEYLRPESFELLEVLFNLDSVLLDEYAKSAREQQDRDLLVEKQTAEKVMGDMAHNIATKFAALPGYLSFYRYYEKRLPELKEVNDDFKHALDQTQAIVRRAKERLSPIRKLKCEQTELKDYLERLLRSHLQHGYTIVSEIGPVQMNLDTHLLEIAFAELIENSKAMHEDSERLKIEIRIRHADKADGTVRIIYRDNGPGVAEEVRPHIFEDFFSHRPSAERASSGLGMGFVKRVIRAHGGNIEVGASETGAEFLVTLPSEVTNGNRDNQSK